MPSREAKKEGCNQVEKANQGNKKEGANRVEEDS